MPLSLRILVSGLLLVSLTHAQTLTPVSATLAPGTLGLAVSGSTLYAVGADPIRALQTYSLSAPAMP